MRLRHTLAPIALALLSACTPTEGDAPDAASPADVATTDAPALDASPQDAAVDVPAPDVGPIDVAPIDVAPLDTAPLDTAPLDTAPVDVAPVDVAPVDVPSRDGAACSAGGAADLLFVVDNSNSMAENQANLVARFGAMIDALTTPGAGATSLRDLHIGVISTDLGTPGSVVPSCANTDLGDDGLLNPIRNGLAIRTHQPWTTAAPGRRPARCTNDPVQYPSFLSFASGATDAAGLREDFVCNAYLSTGGCGLEQQLESAYRALVVRNPRDEDGNTDPNAGFVRADAALGVLFVTDEEDGSVRDCRFAERGVPCTDAVGVFDITDSPWASFDLNLRFYMYTPGTRQDPTWSLDRYMDPTRPTRGFTSLKPGHPERVVVGAITGVPIARPARPDGSLDWDALLGRSADGSDGLVAMSPEGPVSMRQRNMDPMCPTRVVPACRREGTSSSGACDTSTQYFAWPARRVAQLVRRFDERYDNGVLGSICASDYTATMSSFAARLRRACGS
jgi:hypothetical protein